MFYKVKKLSEAGVEVYLHCYLYNREQAPILDKLCKEVFYYGRKMNPLKLLSKQPFIVKSRISKQLIEKLASIDAPILCESLAVAFVLEQPELKDRKVAVRCQNVEHEYYEGLKLVEKGAAKRIYFNYEFQKLEKYESILAKADRLFTVSVADQNYFLNKFGTAELLGSFHPYDEIAVQTGQGDFILYHGNLSVGENLTAANYLIDNIFSQINYPVIIAGKNPSKELAAKIESYSNISMEANVSHERMTELISTAQIQFLYTFQNTGIKLKLLYALYQGRFCIANPPMVEETGLDELCIIPESDKNAVELTHFLFNKDFSQIEVDQRTSILEKLYDNNKGVKILTDYFFND